MADGPTTDIAQCRPAGAARWLAVCRHAPRGHSAASLRPRRRVESVCLLATLLLLGGCDMTRLAAQQTVGVLVRGAAAFEQERDYALARQAAPSNLKMIEGLLEVLPDDPDLLRLAARGFAEYAFAFLEDDFEALDPLDEVAEQVRDRAAAMYERAWHHARRWLALDHPAVEAALDGPVGELERLLQQVEAEHAEALFWVGYAWAGMVNLRMDEPDALMDVPKVVALMKRVVALDETVYHGGAHLVLGSIDASVPPSLGGDPAAARKHFERARAIAGQGYLLAAALQARFLYARAAPDRTRYEATLQAVLDAPVERWPAYRLANEVARRRAARWLAQADTLF